MAAVGDFVAVKYYPEGGSRFLWTFHQMKGNLMKVQNFTHKLADVFCNDPEQCKNATDEFFMIVASFPQEVVLQFADLLSKFGVSAKQQEGGEVNRKRDEAKRAAVNYSNGEVQLSGDPKKGETVIKSLTFSSYDENNLCDLMEGIPTEEYDATVDEIAELTNMPEKVKNVIKRAKKFSEGKVQALEKLQFKTEDGNLVFGRVVVIRRGKLLDMAYSLHSVAYKVEARQRRSENAQKLELFSESLKDGEGGRKEFQGITFELRDDFLAFFHKKAVEGFVKHCDFVLKAMNGENKDAEILQQIGVSKDGKAVEEDKITRV